MNNQDQEVSQSRILWLYNEIDIFFYIEMIEYSETAVGHSNSDHNHIWMYLPINAWFWGYYALKPLIVLLWELCTFQSNTMRA